MTSTLSQPMAYSDKNVLHPKTMHIRDSGFKICKSSQEIWTDMSYCPLIDPGNPVLPTCSSSTTAVTTKEDVMLTMLTKQLHLNKQETKVNYPETLEA